MLRSQLSQRKLTHLATLSARSLPSVATVSHQLPLGHTHSSSQHFEGGFQQRHSSNLSEFSSSADHTQLLQNFNHDSLEEEHIDIDIPDVGQFPPDDVRSEWQGLVENLAQNVNAHVETIVQQIDDINSVPKHGGDTDEPKEVPQVPKPAKHTLANRYGNALHAERRRQSRHRKPHKKRTSDEMWDDALRSLQPEFDILPHVAAVSTTLGNRLESPVLGLPIDENAYLQMNGVSVQDEDYQDFLYFLQLSAAMPQPENKVNVEASAPPTLHDDRVADKVADTIHRALALLSVASPRDWNRWHKVADPTVDDLETQDTWELLRHSQENRYTLSTKECNLLLADMLTSPYRSPDDILGQTLHLFGEMRNFEQFDVDGGPDATTYRLLFLGLSKRLMAVREAANLCSSLTKSTISITPETLFDAMNVCYRCDDLEMAQHLIRHAVDPNTQSRPTLRSFSIWIEMLKTRNLWSDAVLGFDQIREAKLLPASEEDELLLNLCHWPTKTGRGTAIDISPLLVRTVEILADKVSNGEVPPRKLWMTLIDKLAMASDADQSLAQETNRAIQLTFKCYPRMTPGLKFMRTGIRTADATNDAALAADIIARKTQNHLEWSHRNEITTVDEVPIPPQFLKSSLELCLRTGNHKSASSILRDFTSIQEGYPPAVASEFFRLALLCQARAGDPDEARNVLFAMMEHDLEVSSDLFGMVQNCMVVKNRHEEAKALFQSMELLEPGYVKPGVANFNAMLVMHIQKGEWDEAISLHDRMKSQGVDPDSQTLHGVLLAHRRKRGRAGAHAFLEVIAQGDVPIDENVFKLATKMLIPGVEGGLDELRKGIRSIGATEPKLREISLQVVRAARIAEIEERKLQAKEGPSMAIGARKGSQNWNAALTEVLKMSQIMTEKTPTNATVSKNESVQRQGATVSDVSKARS
eukprot:Nitzschia sp. Nitz4//scaffold3_size479765//205103//207949//NITZ4_000087-RA/size479765-augustus-gene-1.564-mRNA-1//1//CDS//3329550719//6722//frame0